MMDYWVHSCCGRRSGECPGCRENMTLIKKSEHKIDNDQLLESVLVKISNKTVTCEDINRLINETTPESIRDRIRRRTTINATDSHQDREGHQPLSLPSFKRRTAPKRKPENQQNHGRARLAHRRSTKTQRKKAKGLYGEEINYIINNIGKPIKEEDMSMLDKGRLFKVISKMMTMPNINRDWLYGLNSILEAKYGR